MAMLTNYIFMLFGVGLVMYLAGYTSLFDAMSAGVPTGTNTTGADEGSHTGTNMLDAFMAIFTNPIFLLSLGLAAVGSFIGGGGNFSVFFLVPILMLVIMANVFILPTSYMMPCQTTTLTTTADYVIPCSSLDPLLAIIITLFFNIVMMLAIVEFVRGGST